MFPILANHVKEDLRPIINDRLGSQNRFGGGTNQLKEDFGININNRRLSWEYASHLKESGK